VFAFALFAAWLAVVVCAAWNHAVWRDEVRALSKALDGGSVFDMLKGLRTEGHPAVWYLLLRGAHTLLPRPEALQVVALLVAAASALLLLFCSPFGWRLKALLLAGNVFLFEYSVMARNYGISMLLLFLLATFYKRHRGRGPLLGILLFLLANCNAPSVLLAGGFLLFWLADLTTGDRTARPRALRTFGWNAVLAMLGVAVSIMTILPASQAYGVTIERPENPFPLLMTAVFLPGTVFEQLLIPHHISSAPRWFYPLSRSLLSIVLFGSTLGLVRIRGIFVAALATLIGFSVFFLFIYPGDYRHQALWLNFLICGYWIAADKSHPPEPVPVQPSLRRAAAIGTGLFVVLLAIQVPIGVTSVLAATRDGPPLSCSRDLGAFIHSRPDLKGAILIADPDFLLEALPYYVSNPTYLMREQRYGNVVVWTRQARLRLTLGDVLGTARRLQHETNKPVVILLGNPLDPLLPARVYHEAYTWEFSTTPEQELAFVGATQLIGSFPRARTNEHFDAYLLKH
jgi:hypothetical protein